MTSFYFVNRVQLNAYADEQQIYISVTDHVALYERMNGELAVSVLIGTMTFQALILGSTNLHFKFVVGGCQIEVYRDIDLFGINIACDLKFHKSISH